MIQKFIEFLGYTGSSELVYGICAIGSVVLVVCLSYTFLNFLFDLVFTFIGKTKR